MSTPALSVGDILPQGRVVGIQPDTTSLRGYVWLERTCSDGTVEREQVYLDELRPAKRPYRVTMTAQAPNSRYAQGVWVVDAYSLRDAEEKGKRSAMMGGWVPLQVHWVETPEENDARLASLRVGETK